eukprot:scaffold169196_cov10-Tisochrysis_lutea.AAC.1
MSVVPAEVERPISRVEDYGISERALPTQVRSWCGEPQAWCGLSQLANWHAVAIARGPGTG